MTLVEYVDHVAVEMEKIGADDFFNMVGMVCPGTEESTAHLIVELCSVGLDTGATPKETADLIMEAATRAFEEVYGSTQKH